jgi:hypothetical protein
VSLGTEDDDESKRNASGINRNAGNELRREKKIFFSYLFFSFYLVINKGIIKKIKAAITE